MPLDANKLKALVAQTLAAAKKTAGAAADVRVSASSRRAANTRFAMNSIISAGDVDETTISCTIALGKRHAASTTNQTDAQSIKDMVERALRMAKLAPEDPEWMAPLKAQKYVKVPGDHDPATQKLAAPVRAQAAKAAIAAAEKDGLNLAG